MKSEIIYSNDSTWFSRYGEYEGSSIVISANFDNPAAWPYTYKRYETLDDEKTEVESKNLPRDLYQKIKDIIASHRELTTCKEHTQNAVSDGSDDAYYFACDAFSRHIYGASVHSCGRYEAEELPAHRRTENYIVYTIVTEITNALQAAGFDVYC
ncbi:MAG: hypothetical protein IJY71_02070 [Clostridia bacterium]|nr:hypothetical protein [Clostridia bacterium]